jgi:hypothetical protein
VAHPDLHIRPARKATEPDAAPRAFADQAISGRVVLDNTSFQRCKFRRATLIYAGGVPPQIRDCAFEEVAFEFQGAAGRTLAFLQAMATPASGLREVVRATFVKVFGH